VDDVLEEYGATYDLYGFADEASFETWVQKKVDWISSKVLELVGSSNYNHSPVYQDIKMAEIFWIIASMMGRRYGLLTGTIEGGFAIGSLRIDSGAKSSNGIKLASDEYFRKAMTLLEPYYTITTTNYLVVEDEDDTSTVEWPADRFYLRSS